MAVALARNAVVIGIDQNGGRIVFQKIVSLAFESDRYSPADSLSFTALDAVSDRLIVRAELALDGKKVFEGGLSMCRGRPSARTGATTASSAGEIPAGCWTMK